MRSHGRCSGKGRRAGFRRSNDGTVILLLAAAIPAAASACAASPSRSASCSSSWSSNVPRSEDWPNRSCRNFRIVYLSLSISSARCCASPSAAMRATRSATSIDFSVSTSLGSESSAVIADEGITCRGACPSRRITCGFKMLRSAGSLRSPCVLRHPPIDAFQQIAELGRRDRHHPVRRRRPEETAPFQPLREQTHPLPVMPEYLDQSAAPATEHEQMPAVRIAPERLLHQERQAIKALAHIGVASRQPDPRATRDWDHCRRLPFASAFISADTVRASTGPVIRIRPPVANSISIVPPSSDTAGTTGDAGAGSATAIGLNAAAICTRSQSCWRHRNNWLTWIPAARATSEALAPGSSAAATIRSFSARDQRRRRCTDVITSTALVIGLALVLALGLAANAQPRKAASTGRLLRNRPLQWT